MEMIQSLICQIATVLSIRLTSNPFQRYASQKKYSPPRLSGCVRSGHGASEKVRQIDISSGYTHLRVLVVQKVWEAQP